MRPFLVFALCISTLLAASGENLLVNPGFDETGEDQAPRAWDLFVMPMPGALGRTDGGALDGPTVAMLYNPEAYAEEPYNNWSQIIDTPPAAGTVLAVTGSIRTADSAEGAIWLQCWRKGPTRVIGAVTSDETTRVAGDTSWTAVAMKLTVPQDTEFLVLRCVLKGKGRAWFDSLSVATAPDAAAAADAPKLEPLDTKVAHDDGKDAEPEATATATPPEPPPAAATPPTGDDLATTLRETNAALIEALREFRATNDSLLQQITALQAELNSLRTEVKSVAPAVGVGAAPVDSAVPEPPHPLVPRGHKFEATRP